MPANTVVVTRATKWGNPFKVGVDGDASACVESFRMMLHDSISGKAIQKQVKEQLRGKNLGCFCEAGQPCHADILLTISNSSE